MLIRAAFVHLKTKLVSFNFNVIFFFVICFTSFVRQFIILISLLVVVFIAVNKLKLLWHCFSHRAPFFYPPYTFCVIAFLLALKKSGSTLKFHRSFCILYSERVEYVPHVHSECAALCYGENFTVKTNIITLIEVQMMEHLPDCSFICLSCCTVAWVLCRKKSEFCGRRTATVCHAVHIDNCLMETQAAAIHTFTSFGWTVSFQRLLCR